MSEVERCPKMWWRNEMWGTLRGSGAARIRASESKSPLVGTFAELVETYRCQKCGYIELNSTQRKKE